MIRYIAIDNLYNNTSANSECTICIVVHRITEEKKQHNNNKSLQLKANLEMLFFELPSLPQLSFLTENQPCRLERIKPLAHGYNLTFDRSSSELLWVQNGKSIRFSKTCFMQN